MKIYELDDGPSVEDDLWDATELLNEAESLDSPGQPPFDYERIVRDFENRNASSWKSSMWAVRNAKRLTAYAYLDMPTLENTGTALIRLTVHPDYRRRGIGSAFLRTLLPVAEAAGRTRVLGSVRENGPGMAWATEAGFSAVHGFVQQELVFAEADPAIWDVPVAEGYELREWVGPAPEELLGPFAAARQAIHDAPSGKLSYDDPTWTPERVREEEAEMAATGIEWRVVVAVRRSDGAVAGLTETQFNDSSPRQAHQGDTSVVVEHRGLGLGRAMKAAMLRKLRNELPEVLRIRTQNAADNHYMAQVSRQVGYRDLWVTQYVEADLADVRRVLG